MTDQLRAEKYGKKEIEADSKKLAERKAEEAKLENIVCTKFQDVLQNHEGTTVPMDDLKRQLLQLLAQADENGWEGDGEVNIDDLQDPANEKYLNKLTRVSAQLMRDKFISVPEKGMVEVHIVDGEKKDENDENNFENPQLNA